MVGEIQDSLEFLGLFFAPVRAYLEDDDVSEILINGHAKVFVERKGRLERVDVAFPSENALKAAVLNVARSVGRRVNEDEPRLDARLPDGSRVHAVIPPLAVTGTAVAIRKFKREALTLQSLVSFGSISQEGADLIAGIVSLHKNVIVCGATSSGKTSVLNVLSQCIDERERILVLEDSSELQLQQEHVVRFETRPADEKGKGEITIRDLLHSSLRLRPDRLVIGEIRGGEAMDLLQAMNTGHSGSLSTVHANSPFDALLRLEMLALFCGVDIPVSSLRTQIASAVDVVVQTARLSDGSRKIVDISEVLPLAEGTYQVRKLYGYEVHRMISGQTVVGEHRLFESPGFADQAKATGIRIGGD